MKNEKLSRRDALKSFGKWSGIALGTVGFASAVGGCIVYGDYMDLYCDWQGQDYWTDVTYCDYCDCGADGFTDSTEYCDYNDYSDGCTF